MGEQLHHLFRRALKFRTQVVTLGTDADRTGVGMALAHHDTTHGDQRRCADTIFIRTKHRCHDDITAGFQPAIRAQHHLVAQIIHRQYLMHFRQPHFPGQAGIFDR